MKQKKSETTINKLKTKEEFNNCESYLFPQFLIRKLKSAATFHKRWETKMEIETEIQNLFPEYQQIEETADFISYVNLTPFSKINLLEKAGRFGCNEEQVIALVDLL